DVSLRNLTGKFLQRVEERFTEEDGRVSFLKSYSDLDEPGVTIEEFLKKYPDAEQQLINAQDLQHFLLLCKSPGQKPVPFVPSLDEDFEYWFKKDSLWQSEDLEAVRSEEHTSELQSRENLVCRLLLERKKMHAET